MGKNKKVLHIITRLIVGGAQENTMYSVEGLIKRGWEVDLLSGPTYGPEGKIIDKILERDIPLYIEPNLVRNINPIRDISAFIKLYKFIKKGKYEVVHTHSSKAGIIGRWAAYFAGTPVIVHTIHGLPFTKYQSMIANIFYIFSEWLTAFITTKILSVSSNIIDQALKYKIGNPQKYQVVRSGLNVDDFLNAMGKGKKIREKFNIKDDDFVFGTLARLFRLKGHKYIISISKNIIKKYKNIKFMFIGDGILRNQFENEIKKSGIRDHFIFTGLIPPEQVAEYLDSCDAIIHTSLREGLPRVIPQAFLLEKPVIAFDVDGTSEVVINGETGFLVTPKDLNNLKKNIIYVINNYQEAKKMALNGKKMILSQFTIEKMVDNLDKLYKRLV